MYGVNTQSLHFNTAISTICALVVSHIVYLVDHLQNTHQQKDCVCNLVLALRFGILVNQTKSV